MKFTTAPAFSRTSAPPENIVVNGEVIGTVTETNIGPCSRYHACIEMRSVARLGGPTVGGTFTLAQGHGPTVEEAVASALATGRRDAVAYIEGLNRLAELMGAA